MELVNGAKRSESRKKKTVQCTVFPAWPLAASPTVGAKMRADDESHLLFCCFGDICSLTVNQDGACERAEIIQSLSQLR